MGSQHETVTEIWLLLHGYGHLAVNFLAEFSTVKPGNALLLAPEGPHRFYLKGVTGDVGAHWMTRENRENDILDNNVYLDTLYHKYKEIYPRARWKVLGFSQGAAAACRWIAHHQPDIAALALWAGLIPPDITNESTLNKVPIFFIAGNNDKYLNENSITHHLNEWAALKIFPAILRFDGGHEIEEKTLNQLIKLW
jgi:predicted esterase